MILKVFPSGPFETNAYLLGCEKTKTGIFIDPAPDSAEALLNAAKKHHLKIEAIFLTHSHWDHIGDVAKLKKLLELQLYIHPTDADNMRKPGSDGLPLMFAIDGVEPDHFFEEGQKLKVGTLEIEVIHTPGHTPGGVSFYLPQEKVLISGDTLFKGSIGNLSFPMADSEAMWESLKKLAKLPPETRVYPGHGPATTIGAEPWLSNAKELFS
ncbi:MAG: MBL fold metallo-hydrolase [Simkania sp.]|nr:MBL fold metallo-hydrolase [Simkania sp.]